jgi:hypothetical protein
VLYSRRRGKNPKLDWRKYFSADFASAKFDISQGKFDISEGIVFRQLPD